MSNVGIITDTIACLPSNIVDEYGIKIIPIIFNINGKRYRDQVDMKPDEFWKIFDDIKEYTTSAPSISEFLELFEETSKNHDSIACTFVSKALSATYESAIQAKEAFLKDHPNIKIELLDSHTATGAEAFIVMEMAKAAKAGKSLEEVIQTGKDMIPKVGLLATLETLKYLIRSGRAPKTAYMGELFQVKPLIGILGDSGVVENMGRARGKEKAYKKVVELMGEYIDADKPVNVFVHYTNSISDGEHLKELVTASFKCEQLFFTPYSTLICGHTGPMVAVTFYPRK